MSAAGEPSLLLMPHRTGPRDQPSMLEAGLLAKSYPMYWLRSHVMNWTQCTESRTAW